MRSSRRQGAAASARVGVALWVTAGAGRAEVIDLHWREGGRFERTLPIAPGKSAEVCDPLEARQAVRWSFEVDRALDFNVHCHADKDVRYPAKQDRVASPDGELAIDAGRDCCRVWANKTPSPVKQGNLTCPRGVSQRVSIGESGNRKGQDADPHPALVGTALPRHGALALHL